MGSLGRRIRGKFSSTAIPPVSAACFHDSQKLLTLPMQLGLVCEGLDWKSISGLHRRGGTLRGSRHLDINLRWNCIYRIVLAGACVYISDNTENTSDFLWKRALVTELQTLDETPSRRRAAQRQKRDWLSHDLSTDHAGKQQHVPAGATLATTAAPSPVARAALSDPSLPHR